MRIYISGPMTGLPDLNFPLFNKVAECLRDNGWDVVNPAEIQQIEGADWAACLKEDIKHLVTCDTIALLPGWHRSKGAALEAYIANKLGLTVREMVYVDSKWDFDTPISFRAYLVSHQDGEWT